MKIKIPVDDAVLTADNPLVIGDDYEKADCMLDMMLSELKDYEDDPNQDAYAMAEQFYLSVMAGVFPSKKALQWVAVALNHYVNQNSPDRGLVKAKKKKTLEQLLGFTPDRPGNRKAALLRKNMQRNAQIALYLDDAVNSGQKKNAAIESAAIKYALNHDDIEKIYKQREKLIAPYIVGAELP